MEPPSKLEWWLQKHHFLFGPLLDVICLATGHIHTTIEVTEPDGTYRHGIFCRRCGVVFPEGE